MKKDLFVFLHGFGEDKNDNKKEIDSLCSLLNTDKFSFNAPFPSGRDRGGYAWFPITKIVRERIFNQDFEDSLNYIEKRIETELLKRKQTWKNVILCGRSQGGTMAIYTGLRQKNPCKAIISICSLFINTKYLKHVSSPDIIWLEAGKDQYFSKEEKKSYKSLIDMDVLVKYFIDEKASHENITNDGVSTIVNLLSKKG